MRSVILSVLLLVTVSGCDNANQRDKAVASGPQEKLPVAGVFDRTHRGKAAPGLTFEAPGGAPVSLASFRGKPLLVNLWATWCAPCIAEMPALDRLALAKRGSVHVVGVSQDMQGWAKVRPFLAKAKLRAIGILLDKDGKLASALNSAGLPMTVLYDAEGHEVWRVNGPREWDEPGAFRLD